jgi:hypothetical protein
LFTLINVSDLAYGLPLLEFKVTATFFPDLVIVYKVDGHSKVATVDPFFVTVSYVPLNVIGGHMVIDCGEVDTLGRGGIEDIVGG